MAGAPDARGQSPWPTHLRVFDPARHSRVEFYGERASIARSLGRPVLPEVIAMYPPAAREGMA